MAKKLFVGNLPFSLEENELRDLFAGVGDVDDVKIITDRETGNSRGFGFVTMKSPEAADKAIIDLANKELGGRKLAVKEAIDKPREDRGGSHRGDYRR